MTFFVVFVSITNIAIGYALAVYLHDLQVPWQFRFVRLKRKTSVTSAAKSSENEVAAKNVSKDDLSNDDAKEADFAKAANGTMKLEEVELAKKRAADVRDSVESVESKIKTAAAQLPSSSTATKKPEKPKAKASSTSEGGCETEEELLADIKSIQSHMKEEEQPPESASQDAVEQTEQPPASSSEQKKSEQREASDHDEVLKGIEAFRAQLASMQQKSTPSAEEISKNQPEEMTIS